MSFSIRDLGPWLLALILITTVLYFGFSMTNASNLEPDTKMVIRIGLAVMVPKICVLLLKRYMKFKRI